MSSEKSLGLRMRRPSTGANLDTRQQMRPELGWPVPAEPDCVGQRVGRMLGKEGEQMPEIGGQTHL